MALMRRYLPKGLFARTLLIIVLPVALMQVAVAWSFFVFSTSFCKKVLLSLSILWCERCVK